MIIAVLSMISKIRKQIYPSTDELIKISNTHIHTYTQRYIFIGFPGGANGKEPACQCRRYETWVPPSLEEEMATYSSILACRIPMDRRAWKTTVYRVTKSQTQLKQLSMCIHTHTLIHNYTHRYTAE